MATLADIRKDNPEYADLSDQQLADGLYKKFYSDMPRADFDKKVGLAVEPSPAIKAGQDIVYAGQWDKPQSNMLEQGMSGLNEGIAAGLGAPVDLATMGINATTRGINALAHTDIPQIEKPVGGTDTFRAILAPTIKPETDDKGQQVVRRISQEVGAMLVPGAGPVAKSAKPLSTAAKEFIAALGSGTGAATAEQIAPNNAFAEFAGQMVGGMTPSGIVRGMRKAAAAAPKAEVGLEELRNATDAAYGKTRQIAATYKPQAYDNMLVDIINETKADGINADRHKDAYSFLINMIADRGQNLTLAELDQLRQRVRRDLITPSYGNAPKAADAHFGQIILDNIDKMIANAKPADMAAGNAAEATDAILTARSLNTRLKKSELLHDAVEKANLAAAASGSGGNINNALRQQLKGILTNPKKVKAFTASERKMMEDVIKGGKLDNLLRLVGKLSPSGNGLMAALGIGGTVMNPSLAAAPLAGMAAKAISDRNTIGKIRTLQRDVANGGKTMPTPVAPFLAPPEMGALLATQAATQKKPIYITVNGGSAR